MLRKILLQSTLALALAAGSVTATYAAGSSTCQVIYGGGEVCPTEIKFTIDKKVQTPNKGGVFVDNLTMNDVKFAPAQEVVYKVRVQNTGASDLSNVKVTDTLPKYISFTSGDGSFDKNSNVYTVNIPSLKKGEAKEFTFVAKTAEANALPQDRAVICGNDTTNRVRATVNEFQATDQSEICIEKGVTPTGQPKVFEIPPMKQTPSTGPEMLSLLALIPTGTAGYLLRKKSK